MKLKCIGKVSTEVLTVGKGIDKVSTWKTQTPIIPFYQKIIKRSDIAANSSLYAVIRTTKKTYFLKGNLKSPKPSLCIELFPEAPFWTLKI